MKNRIILIFFLIAVALFFVVKELLPVKQETVENETIETSSEIIQKDRVPSRFACVGEYCDGSMQDDNSSSRTVLKIPLVKQGGNVGCGSGIFFAPHWIPKTTAVLDATYRLLFDIKAWPEIATDDFHNTVGNYLGLHYDSVSITNGTAKLMLSGNMTGPGHCAEPELREQINQAAFQFDSVNKIEVYLNGALFDWCATSDADVEESHCDTTPQYWIDSE
jgi:hypothetical protein